MKRRTVLASGAATLAGLAGCIDASQSGGAPTQTDEPSETTDDGTGTDDGTDTSDTTTPADAEVTVEHVALQHGYVAPTTPDSIGIRHADRQYLLASVSVEEALPRDAFSLTVGGETVAATTIDRLYRTSWADDQWYGADQDHGLVAFGLSADTDGGAVTLTWPGGEHAIGGTIPDRVGLSTPAMTGAFDLPETVADVNAPPVEITVTNESDRERRFLAGVNRSGPSVAYTPIERVSRLVGPGETVTITVEDDWYDGVGDERIGDGEPDLTYHLHFPGGGDDADIRIVEPSQSETTET